ncbi:oligoendopeptidase F [Aquibacillus halophilus]|uniref:Oligoendopeptidase F n=1 Tax=Aquibacillus halophilus TaxID=930132 RepID=A0A6A8DEJ0_9BACI|nr:M3 family oligoendopeptidase [Aquibacillus halophilus]MRH41327.1 oligoendopeptidase F [Aquibacillus halophilus]
MVKTISENWDLKSLYSKTGLNTIEGKIQELSGMMSRVSESIDTLDMDKSSLHKELVNFLQDMQQVMSGWLEIDEYLICLHSEDVENDLASQLLEESALLKQKLQSIQIKLDQLLISIPESGWSLFILQEEVSSYRFYLEERRRLAQDKLSSDTEQLINQLSVNGFGGWEQLYQQLVSNLKVPIKKDGQEKNVSIGEALDKAMNSTDRSIRQETVKSINEVCRNNADIFASVLNRIAGFRLDIYKNRGWTNILKEVLDTNRIQETTLHTMVATINQHRDLSRRFIERKAQLEKIDKASWYDTYSPTFRTKAKVSYNEAVEIIVKQFFQFSDKLGKFAERAFNEGWIEVEDRDDKAMGGFCASMPVAKESRVFLTFRGNYQDVVTIAHELGHAYHNYILHEEPAFAQEKGTSVAETASTFMENLVLDAVIDQATDKDEKLALLEMKISSGLKYLGMVPNMFQFELDFYRKRQKGLVTADELVNVMERVERDLYGNTIDEVNPYMWMVIGHFYSTEQAFYNIPYTIGYLFSNGIYSLSKQNGSKFSEQYDELLKNSGKMTVEQLAETYLDQDLTNRKYWDDSIKPIRDAVEQYLKLTEDIT